MRRAALFPFILPAALGGAALALGGLGGFLLGFIAALLGIDRALGFAGVSRIEAERAYRRLTRGRSGTLAYLPDDAGWAATAPRHRLGVQTIALDSIAGTTDRHKAESFDAAFRPPAWSRERWMQLWLSARGGNPFPPISVYRFSGRHFVRDGHHRVSVARALGASDIEADVVELRAAGQRAA
ncbi:MAG TPA: hypothetical protein VHJ39_00885 [Solirubrobacteraceae bacterium]|jgi:hypothetical protein|nr:hypothetical protein [Solirubrobacteraceae bacterium]